MYPFFRKRAQTHKVVLVAVGCTLCFTSRATIVLTSLQSEVKDYKQKEFNTPWYAFLFMISYLAVVCVVNLSLIYLSISFHSYLFHLSRAVVITFFLILEIFPISLMLFLLRKLPTFKTNPTTRPIMENE